MGGENQIKVRQRGERKSASSGEKPFEESLESFDHTSTRDIHG